MSYLQDRYVRILGLQALGSAMDVNSILCAAVQASSVVPLRRNFLCDPACAQCLAAMTPRPLRTWP
jgi:hypothetical protein